MPGPLVNISAIILHLLHDAAMDGRAAGGGCLSPVRGSALCTDLFGFFYVNHFGCGSTQSLQGLFLTTEVMLAKIILGK